MIKKLSIYLLGGLMMIGGIYHFINPSFYIRLIPPFMPFPVAIIYLSGVIEVILGVGMLLQKYRRLAATGITLLFIAFLPIHIWECFRENPVVGNTTNAYIRLVLQFGLLFWANKMRK